MNFANQQEQTKQFLDMDNIEYHKSCNMVNYTAPEDRRGNIAFYAVQAFETPKEILDINRNLIKYDLVLKSNWGAWYALTSSFYFYRGQSTSVELLSHSSLNGETRSFSKINKLDLNYFIPLIKILETHMDKTLISEDSLEKLTERR